MRFLLFPRSSYLASRWWHRLATVLFWAWLIGIVLFAYNAIVLEPFENCIKLQVNSEILLNKPSTLNCGTSAFNYLASNMRSSSASELSLGFLVGCVLLYLILALPGLAYRLVLYIAKGGSWRDSAAA